MKEYQAIVIGAGQGGIPLATDLRDAGWKVAIIEQDHLGGTCINRGCTPTKTMISSGRVAYLANRSTDYGVHLENMSVNLREVKARKDAIVQSFRDGLEKRLEGVDIIRGKARMTAPDTIEVNGEVLRGEKLFINTGARPKLPDPEGLTSTTIMDLEELPEHLLVVGGGYIGLEFGQLFRRFGSRVTIMTHGKQILSREDPEIAEAMQGILEASGIEVLLNKETVDIPCSKTLYAIGRMPNTEWLDGHIEIDDHGFVKVNEYLETSTPNVYAIGDVKGGPAFTHISYDDYRILRENLLNHGNRTTHNRYVPYTLFTDPQLGRIGMTEKEAKQRGLDYSVATIPMSYVARAIEVGETQGVMKAVIDNQTDRILGAAVLGIEGGELMATLQVAMMGDLPYTALRDATFAHPTLAESLNTLFSHISARDIISM